MSSRIEQIIEEIEEYVESCKYQPLSTTKIVVNKEELEELEIKSAENIFYKKTNSMEDEEIKHYLLKKGYKSENISIAMEIFNE